MNTKKSSKSSLSANVLRSETSETIPVIVAETRKLSDNSESVLSLLRQENDRLTRVLSDLRQNHSSTVVERHNTRRAEAGENRVVFEDGNLAAETSDSLQGAMNLVEESIRVYDEFIKGELNRAESELCRPECYGPGDATCEACPSYREATCEVAQHVRKYILDPFTERVDDLKNSAISMLTALNKCLKKQFGVSINSGESST